MNVLSSIFTIIDNVMILCVCVCVCGGGAMCIACKVPLCVCIHTVYSICIVDHILNSNLHKNQHATNFQEANYCIREGMSVFYLLQYNSISELHIT